MEKYQRICEFFEFSITTTEKQGDFTHDHEPLPFFLYNWLGPTPQMVSYVFIYEHPNLTLNLGPHTLLTAASWPILRLRGKDAI